MSINREELERALARQQHDQTLAGPRALAAHQYLLDNPGKTPDVPEAPGDIPNCFPYKYLSESSARSLMWLSESLPIEKALEAQAMWIE